MRTLPLPERLPLKYAATINDETLGEDTAPDFELKYIDIGNVDSRGKIRDVTIYCFADAPSRARRIVRNGDVIISTVRTYLQAIAPIESPPDNLIVSTGFAVIRPRQGTLDTGYCKYALREPEFLHGVLTRSVGISYPAISALDLGNISILMHPFSVQRAIADFLDHETSKLDKLITEKERLLKLLAEKRRALITQAVTRRLDPDVTMRDSGAEWLGEIPEHWKVQRLAFLFRERDERDQPELPLLNVSIHTGVTIREFSDSHIEQMAEDFSIYKVAYEGDIAFNKMRMWQGAVGRVPTDGLVSPDYVVAAPTSDVDSEYYAELFRIAAFSAEAARCSHGIVWDRLRLYWEGFRDIRVPVPSLDEQREIMNCIRHETKILDQLYLAAEYTIELLHERRAALISAAVTGQIRITKESCNSSVFPSHNSVSSSRQLSLFDQA